MLVTDLAGRSRSVHRVGSGHRRRVLGGDTLGIGSSGQLAAASGPWDSNYPLRPKGAAFPPSRGIAASPSDTSHFIHDGTRRHQPVAPIAAWRFLRVQSSSLVRHGGPRPTELLATVQPELHRPSGACDTIHTAPPKPDVGGWTGTGRLPACRPSRAYRIGWGHLATVGC